MANKQSHTGGTPPRTTTGSRMPFDEPGTHTEPIMPSRQSSQASSYQSSSNQQAQQLRDKIAEGVEQTKDKLSDLKETVTTKAEQGMESAKHTMQDAQEKAGEMLEHAGRTVITTVKENPLPIAMAVVGLGWLTASLLSGAASAASTRSSTTRGSTTRGSTRDNGGASLARRGQSSMQRIREQAMQRGRALQEKTATFTQDNPLLAGAALLGLGALLGLLLPGTKRENAWLGQQRDRFIDSAQQVARTALDKIESVAHAVTSSGESSPQTH